MNNDKKFIKRPAFKGLIIFAVVIILLAVTNPTKDDFMDYVSQKIEPTIQTSNDLFSQIGMSIAGSLFKGIVERQNIFIASKFTINIAGENVEYIGFLKKFFIRL